MQKAFENKFKKKYSISKEAKIAQLVERLAPVLPSFPSPLFHENQCEFETHRRQYCSRTFLGQCVGGLHKIQ